MAEKKLYRKRITEWPSEVDEVIRECYCTEMFPVVKLRRHPVTSHYPFEALKRRAYSLGLRVRILSKYSEEEANEILRLSATKTPFQISKIISQRNGKKRTPGAIKHFLISRKIPIRPDTYSITDIAVGLRCTYRKVIFWIGQGKLKARRDPGQKSQWRILPIHIAQFIYRHPFELETCRPDIPWIISLILEYRNSLDERSRIDPSEKQEDFDEES